MTAASSNPQRKDLKTVAKKADEFIKLFLVSRDALINYQGLGSLYKKNYDL
jgi:hypothetical protein